MHSHFNCDHYPFHDLESVHGKKFIENCRVMFNRDGILALHDFFKIPSVKKTLEDINLIRNLGHRMVGQFSPYSDNLSEGDNVHLPENHPRRMKLPASHTFIAGDLISESSPLKQLYRDLNFQKFISCVLGGFRMYPLGDELGALNYLIYEAGDENGWHFDTTENVISVILQLPESGGDYQYICNLRSPENERLEQISERMKNPDSPLGVDSASLSPGTLLFFKGKNTLHRVTRVSGTRERVVAILSYHNEVGHQISDGSRMAMYGRVAKLN